MKLKELLSEEYIPLIDVKASDIVDGKFPESFKNIPKCDVFNCEGTVIGDELLTSLEYSPVRIDHNYNVENHKNLTSLEFAPNYIGNNAFFYGNDKVTSLKGIGRSYLKHIGNAIYLPGNVRSNVLGIMLIHGLKKMPIETNLDNEDWLEVISIIRKSIRSNNDMLECQEELISKGFKEYAKL